MSNHELPPEFAPRLASYGLDERTRRSGLQHVAQLRAQIEAQAKARREPQRHGRRPAAPDLAA